MDKQSWFFYWLMQIFKLQVVGLWPVGLSVYVGLCYFSLFTFLAFDKTQIYSHRRCKKKKNELRWVTCVYQSAAENSPRVPE